MKKALFLILAFALLLGLCACGSKEAEPTSPAATATAPTEEENDLRALKAAAGTYRSRLWFLDHTLNDDLTYTFGESENGTFHIVDKYITMTPEEEASERYFIAEEDCIYTMQSWHFDADVDSGVTFSPNSKGVSDQSFEGTLPDGTIPGCAYNWILLDLDMDGSFTLKLGNKDGNTAEEKEDLENCSTNCCC